METLCETHEEPVETASLMESTKLERRYPRACRMRELLSVIVSGEVATPEKH